jgi:hypothetical protein
MNQVPSTKPQIVGPAKDVYDRLPNVMQHTVDDWLEDRPHAVLYGKFEVLDAWLEYTGIIGYGEDFRKLFEALK